MKLLPTVCLFVLILVTSCLAWIFFVRLNMPFNSEGRYFDQESEIVYHQQSVIVYGIAASAFAVLTIIVGFLFSKKTKKAN